MFVGAHAGNPFSLKRKNKISILIFFKTKFYFQLLVGTASRPVETINVGT